MLDSMLRYDHAERVTQIDAMRKKSACCSSYVIRMSTIWRLDIQSAKESATY